jgi:hypothetical protein
MTDSSFDVQHLPVQCDPAIAVSACKRIQNSANSGPPHAHAQAGNLGPLTLLEDDEAIDALGKADLSDNEDGVDNHLEQYVRVDGSIAMGGWV